MKNPLTLTRNQNLLLFCFIPFLICSCDVAKQAQQAANLANCDFRIRSVENVELAGVRFQNINAVGDLSLTDAARVMAAFASPTFPLSLQLNLEGRNPNTRPAGLNRMEWMLYIDDIMMTTGVLDQPFLIPAAGNTNIPVQIAFDLKTVLSGKSADALIRFCLNLAGMGSEPTRFKIMLKPTIMVGQTPLRYPGYITVRTKYGN